MSMDLDVREVMKDFEVPSPKRDQYRAMLKHRIPSSNMAKKRADEIYHMIKRIIEISQELEESGADESTKNAYYLLYLDLIELYQKEINTSLDNIIENCDERTDLYPGLKF